MKKLTVKRETVKKLANVDRINAGYRSPYPPSYPCSLPCPTIKFGCSI